MLSHKYRFHSRGGVNFVRQRGKRLRTANFTIFYMPNTHRCRRFSVVISKKVLKSAVGRNRLRRRFYEALRLELPPNLPPTDYIFILHNTTIGDIPFLELRRYIRDAISQTQQYLSYVSRRDQ